MGREIRRVPVDFDWEMNKTWPGYLMPDNLNGQQCPDCVRGYTHAGEWVHQMMYRLGMLANDIGEQERGGSMHPWLDGDPMAPDDTRGAPVGRNGVWVTYPHLRPSRDILDLVTALSGESEERLTGVFGGCSATAFRMTAKLAELLGLPEKWGWCQTCEGHGTVEKYPGQRAEAEAWERVDPPNGEGWQLWETVSEGSPISPVFPDAEGLIEWMTTPSAKWGAMGPWTHEQAAAFVHGPGWAPTFMATASTGLVDGVTAVAEAAR